MGAATQKSRMLVAAPIKARGISPPHRHAAICQIILQDRKSTRLNSSHANISYAVFCLKKKKLGSIVRPRTDIELLLVYGRTRREHSNHRYDKYQTHRTRPAMCMSIPH